MENLISKHGVKISDETKITAILSTVYGRATKWTMSWSAIDKAVKNAENLLDKAGVAESRRIGITAHIKSRGPAKRGGSFSSSVKGTEAVIRRYKEGWRLTDVMKWLGLSEQCRAFR